MPNRPEPSLHGRLLLAEDDPNIQRIICLLLRKAGQEVDVAVNGLSACQMAEQSEAEGKPYDLILMDIQMPKLDGYQATGRLRERGWQGPIVALTAHAMVGDREKCLAAGCDDYLAKPVLMSGLREVLERYLGQTAVPTDRFQAIQKLPPPGTVPRLVGRVAGGGSLGETCDQELLSFCRTARTLTSSRPAFGRCPERGQ